MRFIKQYKFPLLFAILSITFYCSFGYGLERFEFIKLISLYTGLFISAYFVIEKSPLSFNLLVFLGIGFRLVFLVAIPNLSQDFYRFLWDGRLLLQGVSPYLFAPSSATELVLSGVEGLRVTMEQFQQLIEGMGTLNAGHFSNYPPINQLFFAVAALFAGKSIMGSVIVLRVLIILADVGILYFGKRLLEKLNLPIKNIFWYFLNPFIIIELTGNLHFEGVMLFFFIWGMYLLFKGKWFWAAVLIGLSVSVKLIPLLFLPIFLKYFCTSKHYKTSQVLKPCEVSEIDFGSLFKFYSVIGLTVLATFLPFISAEFLDNFSKTTALWFQNFEFNASVYYIIRWIGFQTIGWNIIGTVGKILPILIFLSAMALSLFRKNNIPKQLFISMLFAITLYFLLSTTVHPWYLATPLLLSIFTRFKFPIVWSFVVLLSYAAYGNDGFKENLWLVALEYVAVLFFMVWEVFKFEFYSFEKGEEILKTEEK
ncbi:DUF2029 domain-containing protein [Vitellibacter sp. q18]|nr:DUF2029 domain-containing protein [Aequorivita lutea]